MGSNFYNVIVVPAITPEDLATIADFNFTSGVSAYIVGMKNSMEKSRGYMKKLMGLKLSLN